MWPNTSAISVHLGEVKMSSSSCNKRRENYERRPVHPSGMIGNPFTWTRWGLWDARGYRRKGDSNCAPQGPKYNQPVASKKYCGC